MSLKSRPPRKVVYVITTTGVGGAERQVFELATTFRSRGWQVGVVSMKPMHEQFMPLAEAGVELASLEMTMRVPDPRALVRFARILRRWRPSVVHAHMVHANLLARSSRLLAPVPRLICTMHNQDEGPQWRYYAYRLTDGLSDATTAVSQLAVEEAARRGAAPMSKIRLIPNGIRVAQFDRDRVIRESTRTSLRLGDDFMWLSVGRLTEAKRHTDLLDAVRLVRKSAPNVRLLIVGSGPLRAELERRISSAGLGAIVSMMGERDDVRALMQAADGFVMSSAWEGLPMVMLEASASSLPIVATDVGGSRDVVDEPETGFLVPAHQPERLAEAMLQVMQLAPKARESMGDRARQTVIERFDLDVVADDWEELYRSR